MTFFFHGVLFAISLLWIGGNVVLLMKAFFEPWDTVLYRADIVFPGGLIGKKVYPLFAWAGERLEWAFDWLWKPLRGGE